jgi:hypothetical protein
MGQFRPQVTIEKNQYNTHMFSLQSYDKAPTIKQISTQTYPYKPIYSIYEYHESKVYIFRSYQELKKELRQIMREHFVSEATVHRSKKGEWGEWFEVWGANGKRLKKISEGWM